MVSDHPIPKAPSPVLLQEHETHADKDFFVHIYLLTACLIATL